MHLPPVMGDEDGTTDASAQTLFGDINGLHPGLSYYFKGMLAGLLDYLWTRLGNVNWV